MLTLVSSSPVLPLRFQNKQCFSYRVTQNRRPFSASYLRYHCTPLFAESEGKEETPSAEETTENIDAVVGAPEEEAEAPVEKPPVVEQPKRTPLSKSMKDKLRNEYIGLGGAENKAMGTNWFLVISLVIAALAVGAKLSGSI